MDAGDAGSFVVTSGRAGSTALARSLRSHPELVVISDLLEPVTPDRFLDPTLVVDGPGFWAELTRPAVPERVAQWRRQPTAELLHLPDRDADVSLLMAYTLPFLTDDPWALRAELEAEVRTWVAASAPDHLTRTFDWLRDRFGGTTWVERTGGSLPHAPLLVDRWPDARFVELVRDPVEVALSMRTGSFFRLCLAEERGVRAEWLDARHADPVALATMLERWTVGAAEALATIPTARSSVITYERLVREPEPALVDVAAALLGRPPTSTDHEWAAREAASWAAPPSHRDRTPAATLERVAEACPTARARWTDLVTAGR